MTIIDDELFGELVREAGQAFEVPENGASDILEEAFGDAPTLDGKAESPLEGDGQGTSRLRRLGRYADSHRFQTAAACAVVVALAVAIAVPGSQRTPPSGKTTVRAASGAVHKPSKPEATVVPDGTKSPPVYAPDSQRAAGTVGALSAAAPGVAASPKTRSTHTSAGALRSAPSGKGAAPSGKAAAKAKPSTTSPPPLPTTEVGQSSKIEQTGSLSLAVAKGAVSRTMGDLVSLATSYGGFVASQQTQDASGTGATGTVTVQVPVADFAALVKQAQGLGHTTALSTKATDVTGKFVTLQSQITALQASLQQYETIMTHATSIGDILSVQAQINTIQTQIQQLQGQLQLLTHETTYSTLTVTVAVKGAPPPKVHHHHAHPESGLTKAWHESVHGFVDGVEGLIRVVGPLLFALLLAAALIVGARLGWRRYRRHAL